MEVESQLINSLAPILTVDRGTCRQYASKRLCSLYNPVPFPKRIKSQGDTAEQLHATGRSVGQEAPHAKPTLLPMKKALACPANSGGGPQPANAGSGGSCDATYSLPQTASTRDIPTPDPEDSAPPHGRQETDPTAQAAAAPSYIARQASSHAVEVPPRRAVAAGRLPGLRTLTGVPGAGGFMSRAELGGGSGRSTGLGLGLGLGSGPLGVGNVGASAAAAGFRTVNRALPGAAAVVKTGQGGPVQWLPPPPAAPPATAAAAAELRDGRGVSSGCATGSGAGSGSSGSDSGSHPDPPAAGQHSPAYSPGRVHDSSSGKGASGDFSERDADGTASGYDCDDSDSGCATGSEALTDSQSDVSTVGETCSSSGSDWGSDSDVDSGPRGGSSAASCDSAGSHQHSQQAEDEKAEEGGRQGQDADSRDGTGSATVAGTASAPTAAAAAAAAVLRTLAAATGGRNPGTRRDGCTTAPTAAPPATAAGEAAPGRRRRRAVSSCGPPWIMAPRTDRCLRFCSTAALAIWPDLCSHDPSARIPVIVHVADGSPSASSSGAATTTRMQLYIRRGGDYRISLRGFPRWPLLPGMDWNTPLQISPHPSGDGALVEPANAAVLKRHRMRMPALQVRNAAPAASSGGGGGVTAGAGSDAADGTAAAAGGGTAAGKDAAGGDGCGSGADLVLRVRLTAKSFCPNAYMGLAGAAAQSFFLHLFPTMAPPHSATATAVGGAAPPPEGQNAGGGAHQAGRGGAAAGDDAAAGLGGDSAEKDLSNLPNSHTDIVLIPEAWPESRFKVALRYRFPTLLGVASTICRPRAGLGPGAVAPVVLYGGQTGDVMEVWRRPGGERGEFMCRVVRGDGKGVRGPPVRAPARV